MSPRRWSGLTPIGIPLEGLRVNGALYFEIKQRLALIEPNEPGDTTQEQRQYVGAEPVMADLGRPGPGGWRQPEALPLWTPPDIDEFETPEDMRIVLSIGTTRRLEADA